jgi:hypothetical protein
MKAPDKSRAAYLSRDFCRRIVMTLQEALGVSLKYFVVGFILLMAFWGQI